MSAQNMSKTSKVDVAVQTEAIYGRFEKDRTLHLQWLPMFVDEFPKALEKVSKPLKWDGGHKFISATKILIPKKHGVYCFSVDLGEPFPAKIHLPLYIGKAPNQYLSERYEDYLSEIRNPKGREEIVVTLNKYKERLLFWWIVLPRVYVDTVEEHLLMCCKPPCNKKGFDRERFWGKAFE